LTASDSVNLPPLISANVPPSPPEPLVRWIRGFNEADRFDSADGELLEVHCGGCLLRAFDLEIARFAWINADGIVEYRRTNRVLVGRACPKCGAIKHGYVTLAPGYPLSDSLNGRWLCQSGCGASLAYVDVIKGRIKARCKRCEQNVTTSARNAFFGNLQRVEEERERRQSADLDMAS
jgi:hypothetical protein